MGNDSNFSTQTLSGLLKIPEQKERMHIVQELKRQEKVFERQDSLLKALLKSIRSRNGERKN